VALPFAVLKLEEPKGAASALQDRSARHSVPVSLALTAREQVADPCALVVCCLVCCSDLYLNTTVGFRVQVWKVYVWAWSLGQAPGFAVPPRQLERPSELACCVRSDATLF
jgi:hypothetical protein